MDVIEEAIDEFTDVLEFYEEWVRALRKTGEWDEELEKVSLERHFFAMTLKRHVSIVRRLAVNLYEDFDLYVVEKNRNPFVVKRDGKRPRRLNFGQKLHNVSVDTKHYEVFTPFQQASEALLTNKERKVINKLYGGVLKIFRLQSFVDDIQNDPPAEKGEEIAIELVANSGKVVRGMMTLSPNALTEKEIQEHLDVIHSCNSLTGAETSRMDEVEFGLKLILSKLKRMRRPYVTTVQNVVELDDFQPEDAIPQIELSGDGDKVEVKYEETCPLNNPFVKYPEVCHDGDGGEKSPPPTGRRKDDGDGPELVEPPSETYVKHPRTCVIQ